MARESSPGDRRSFRGRTQADAFRRARAEMGDDTALVAVEQVIDDATGQPRVEVTVVPMGRLGTPTLIEYLNRTALPTATTTVHATQDVWPPRYRRVLDDLVEVGVRPDQAEIVCQEAMEADGGLDALPWEMVRLVMERLAPCSPPLDLSKQQVFGLAGTPGTGRTTVGLEICRMASEIVPGRVALLSDDGTVESEDGFEVVYIDGANEAAEAVSSRETLRVVVIDLPTVRAGVPRLGYGRWFDGFAGLTLIPVVDAKSTLAESVGLVNRCAEARASGWIMTGMDDDSELGAVLSLALATLGPLGIQGCAVGGLPRLQLARWKIIFDRLKRQLGDEPGVGLRTATLGWETEEVE
jgi:hypothetical protein